MTKLSITLPIELTNGNDGRGGAFWSSAKVRKQIETLLVILGHERVPFKHRCQLRIVRIIGKGQRLWDMDSILRGNAKELIDALVAVGWFVDDSPKYIGRVIGEQDETQRDNGPAVLVEVTAMEDER